MNEGIFDVIAGGVLVIKKNTPEIWQVKIVSMKYY